MPEPSRDQSRTLAPPWPAAHDAREANRWPVLETLHSALLALMPAFMGIAPRLVPALLALTAVLTVAEVLRAGMTPGDAARAIFRQVPLQAALALMAFAALSALWATDRQLAIRSVFQVGFAVLATGTLTALLPAHLAGLPGPRRIRFVRAVPIGAAIALAFVLLEFATGNAISLALLSRFPTLMGDNAKEFVREGDKILGFVPFYLDRNVAALTLLLPAVLLALRAWLDPGRAAWLVGLAVMAAVAALSLSWSGSAKLAAVLGVLAALAFTRWPARVPLVLMVVLAGGVLAALPLGHLPSRLGFETAPWLPPSARERAMIWDRTASAAQRTPWLGIGVQSTRHQTAGEQVRIEGVRGARRELGWHAHNVVLQSWLEMGLAGALLLLGLGLAMLRSIAALAPPHGVAAMALFAMVAGIGLTGWGMWQPWLVAVVGASLASLWVSYPAGRGSAP